MKTLKNLHLNIYALLLQHYEALPVDVLVVEPGAFLQEK
jgi:hypothetical protein